MFEPKVKAPDFVGISDWINSGPLTIDSLRGKVILIDFWTYTCVNCLRTLPHMKKWHDKYSKSGLAIIGVHSPEFSFERDARNVRKAVKDLGITYPVALDSGMETWNSYANDYWPAKYLVDKDGNVKHVQYGEGGYDSFENEIQKALGIDSKIEKAEYPETYLGVIRNPGMGSGLACDKSGCDVYIDPGEHERDVVYPNGQWVQENEYLDLKKGPGQLAYRFNARQVNMVMGAAGENPVDAHVIIDGKETGILKIEDSKMYTVFEEKKYGEHELVVLFDGPVRVYVYTFG
jgi:thiol-disulfide isomerase/thioredoxin